MSSTWVSWLTSCSRQSRITSGAEASMVQPGVLTCCSWCLRRSSASHAAAKHTGAPCPASSASGARGGRPGFRFSRTHFSLHVSGREVLGSLTGRPVNSKLRATMGAYAGTCIYGHEHLHCPTLSASSRRALSHMHHLFSPIRLESQVRSGIPYRLIPGGTRPKATPYGSGLCYRNLSRQR
jgi:hypothetical protein